MSTDATKPQNIIQGLLDEIARCRETLAHYEAIPEGAFGAAMIKREIAIAELAIAQGDTIKMIVSYQNLKEVQ